MIRIKLISFIVIFGLLFGVANAKEEKKNKAGDGRGIALESVGTLSSSNLYLAYLSLTLIKKNIDKGEFDEQFKNIITPVEHTLGLITNQLKKLKGIDGLSKEDLKIISDIEKACSLLKDDTALLKQYLVSKSDKDNKAFIKKHEETGAFLEKLFTGGTKEEKK